MKFHICKYKKSIFFLLIAAFFIIFAQNAHAAMNFQASPAIPDTDTKMRLDWSPVPGAKIYRVMRDDGSGFVPLADIDVDNVLDPLTYTDINLRPDTEYNYAVKAYSDSGLTNLLDEKTAVGKTTAMIRPYNLRASYDINSKKVTLTWASSSLATGSIVHMTQNGATTFFNVTGTTSAVIDMSTLQPAQFTVQSTAETFPASLKSDPITVIPIEPPFITATSSGGTATISWAYFPQINQFQLERSRWNGFSWESWVTVNSALSGTSATDTPPAGGLYRYRLYVKSGSAYTGMSNYTTPTIGLPAPSNLSLTIFSINRIDLNWTNGTGNTAQIQVLRKMADGTFTQIALLPGTATSFYDTVAVTPGGIYTYRVRSYESDTSFSAPAEASIKAALPEKPGPLFANVVSSSAIRLNWTDLSNNEQGFKIERLTDAGVFTEIGATGPNTDTYTDNSVASGHTYIYRVRAYNVLGSSAYSNEVTINAWDQVPPAMLEVTPVSSTRIDLAWSYTGSEKYNTIIERKKGTDGTWTPIYTTALGAVKYSDTGLLPNTRYFYRIRKALGTGSYGVSYPNNDIGIGAYTYLPDLSLSGSAASGNTIRLTWTGNTSGADVIIERKMPNGSFSALTTVGPSTSAWYDNTGLVPGASYIYRVKARTATNESLYSAEITVQNTYLEAPSGLSASVGTGAAITLKWTDNSTDETGFEIWRYVEGTGTGTYTLYATVDKNITTFTDNTVHTGLQYHYRVRAYIASGSMYSDFSNTASVGVGLINPPANLYYTYISSTQVLLRWTDTSDNESGFKIERKIGKDGEWTVVDWLEPNRTAYTASNLNPYTKYYYRVRAYTTTGNADSVSEEILVSTALPASPSDVSAVSLSASHVKITWKDNSDSEDGFKILRKPSFGYYFTQLAEVVKDATVYFDNSVQPGVRYEYKVVAYNATGSSESAAAGVRTNTKAYFSDIGGVSWAKDAIENLAGMGIIKGVSETLFKPNKTMSKAEFTAIVVRAFGFKTAPVGRLADVKADKWYYNEVMIAENFGLISGDGHNRFYPDAPITREEIAMILFKALVASEKDFTAHDNSVLEKFSDKNNISPQAVSSVATMVGEGIMEGLPGNAIGPKYTATRAQAAVFMFRILNRVNK